MKSYMLLSLLVLQSLIFQSAHAQKPDASLTLLGVAEYSQLRKPFYIAGLYNTNSDNDTEKLLSVGGEKRLELRVVAPQYSQRRFSLQWSQALIISADQATLLNFDAALVKFQNIIDTPFQQGDVITIASSDSGASKVYLNQIEAFSVKKPGFLELILSTWIGNKPPSTEFKQALLTGNAPVSVQDNYASINPSATRIASVKDEIIARAAPKKTANKPVLVSSKTASKPAPKATVAAAPKPVIEQPKLVAKAKPPKPAPKPVVVAQAEPEEPEIDPAIYQQQQETLRKLYAASSTRKIQSNVRYPDRAIQKNHQGVVKVLVTIRRSGLIESMEIVEKARFKTLNNAALKAVEDAGQLNALPPALDAETMDVIIPFAFKLS